MVENLKKIIKNAYTPYSKYNVACILIMTVILFSVLP